MSFMNICCILPAESNGYLPLGISYKLYSSPFLNNFKPDFKDQSRLVLLSYINTLQMHGDTFSAECVIIKLVPGPS